jgi:hypothetical protein
MAEAAYHGLQITDMIGVFYEENGRIMVADEFDGARDVLEVIGAIEAEDLRLLAHHRPVEPLNKERWGGGCCFLENTEHCHFGHHEKPLDLYTFNAVGTLRVEGMKMFVDTREGKSEECFLHFLTGHRSQIVVTSIPNLDELDEKVKSFDPSNIENPTLENLTDRLSELRDFMSKMNDLKNDL